jgi:intraflagellar transport protein 57
MQAHSKVGTPLYMSPEVLRGKGYAFKSDVWSLGCILYELAVLKSPFKEEGLSLYGLFQKISKGVYPEIPPPYSDELRKMVHRMLDVDVSKRATIKDVCSVANKMRMVTEEARRKRKEQEAALKAEEAARKYVQKIENSSSGGGGGSDTSSPTKQLHDDDNNNNNNSNNNKTYEGKRNNNIDNNHSERAQQQHATTNNNNNNNKIHAGSKFSSPVQQQNSNTMDRRSSSERRRHKKKRNNGPVRAKPHPPPFSNDGNNAHAKKTSTPPMRTQRQNVNNLTMLSPEKYNPNYNRGSDHHHQQSKSSNSSSSTTSNNNNSSSSSSLAQATSILLMEEALEKLKVLGDSKYTKKQYTRVYFAIDTNNKQNKSGQHFNNRYNQFQDFIHLSANLLIELGHHVNKDILDGMQNPLHTVREILDSMITVGFPSDAAGVLSVTALTRGYGHEVCTALNWLLDQVLKRRRFKWRKPEYPEEALAMVAEVDDTAEIEVSSGKVRFNNNTNVDGNKAGDTIEDNVATDDEDDKGEEEILYSELIREKTYSAKHDDADDEDREKMESEVDPLTWKIELERVRPRLKTHGATYAKEWRNHIEQSTRHKGIISCALPDAKKLLTRVSEGVKDSLERVATREKYLNNSYSKLVNEYQMVREKMKRLTLRQQEAGDKVSEYTNELQDVTDKLDIVKNTMEERGSSMTDTTPLVRIKKSIKQLKEEILEMELRMGVLSHSLMEAKIYHRNAKNANIYEGKVGGNGTRRNRDKTMRHSSDEDSDDDGW